MAQPDALQAHARENVAGGIGGERRKAGAITKAQKLRMRLGGSSSLLDPLPDKPPPRMHWQTYRRLLGKAIAAEDRMVAIEIDWPRTRYGVT